MTGPSETPPISDGAPTVKRGTPLTGSVPMVETKRLRLSEMMPLLADPAAARKRTG